MKVIFFKTKIFSFKKHLRNESVFETRIIFFLMKIFFWKTFAKRKCFRNESTIVLVCETFFCFLFFKKMPETKTFQDDAHGPPYCHISSAFVTHFDIFGIRAMRCLHSFLNHCPPRSFSLISATY